MHYRSISELPPDIQTELPKDAQEVYREIFNQNFPASRERITSDSEGLAHQAAWRAVKERYEFSNATWKKKI